MAFPAGEPQAQAQAPVHALGSWWKRLVAHAESYPLERIGLAAIAAGVVLRFAAPFFMDLRSDGNTYAAMGHWWSMRHEFVMPWGDVTTWGPMGEAHSNHYPPAYPFYLGVVFTLFGFGLWQAKIAAVVVSLAAVAVVYATTRDLYGRVAAALAGGLIALEPGLLWVTGAGFSENMVLLFFALTMWAILKSLRDDRWIVLAGLFAALAYLSRASVGYFFVVAGGGGLLWRIWFRGLKVFTNVWYLGAIALFLGVAGSWAVRNSLLFAPVVETGVPAWVVALATPLWRVPAAGLVVLGLLMGVMAARWWSSDRAASWIALGWVALGGVALAALALWHATNPMPALTGTADLRLPAWETSSYTRYVQGLAFEKPDLWGKALLAKVPFFAAFAAWYVLAFPQEAWKATKRIREEETSALWLSVFLVWVIAWAISAMFWVFEQSPLFWLDNHRYILIGLLPLAWLLLREAHPERLSFRLRYGVLLVSLFVACAATIASPVKFADLRAAQYMDALLEPGDEVAVDGNTIKYAFYAYLSEPEEIEIYGWVAGQRPHFIVTMKEIDYGAEFVHAGTFKQTFWNGGVMTAKLLVREDVLTSRGIPTGIEESS